MVISPFLTGRGPSSMYFFRLIFRWISNKKNLQLRRTFAPWTAEESGQVSNIPYLWSLKPNFQAFELASVWRKGRFFSLGVFNTRQGRWKQKNMLETCWISYQILKDFVRNLSLKLTVRTCLKPSEKETIVFQPSIFRCYVSLREGICFPVTAYSWDPTSFC